MSSSLSFLSRLSPLVLAVQNSDHGSSPACSASPLIAASATSATAKSHKARDLLHSCQQTVILKDATKSDHSISSASSFCANCECNYNRISLLREENDRLRHALQETKNCEKRRQKYDQERQEYIQRLLSALKALQIRSNEKTLTSGQDKREKYNTEKLPTGSGSQSDFLSDPTPVEYANTTSLSSPAEGHNFSAALEKSYERCIRENVRLQHELDEMKLTFDMTSRQMESIAAESKTKMDVLQMQLALHKEDWEAEKAEKERALAQVDKLRSQLKGIQSIMNTSSPATLSTVPKDSAHKTSHSVHQPTITRQAASPSIRSNSSPMLLPHHSSFHSRMAEPNSSNISATKSTLRASPVTSCSLGQGMDR